MLGEQSTYTYLSTAIGYLSQRCQMSVGSGGGGLILVLIRMVEQNHSVLGACLIMSLGLSCRTTDGTSYLTLKINLSGSLNSIDFRNGFGTVWMVVTVGLRGLAVSDKVQIVAVYLVDKSFGGPEEGGWWFETGEFIRQVKQFKSVLKACTYSHRFNSKLRSRKFGPNLDRPSISSVLSEGEYQALVFEDRCPENYPLTRPFYE